MYMVDHCTKSMDQIMSALNHNFVLYIYSCGSLGGLRQGVREDVESVLLKC